MPDEDRPRLIDSLTERWRDASRNQRRGVYMSAIWLILIVAALIVADSVWRDDLSRSAIAVVTLTLMVVTALHFFGRRGWGTIAAVVGAAVIIFSLSGVTGLHVETLLPDGPIPAGAVICPALPDGHHFHGEVAEPDFGYTHLRAEPTLDAKIGQRYSNGCEVAFDSWCLGEPKNDWRFDVPDPVWLSVVDADPDYQYIASADVKAGPAGEHVSPRPCPEDKPRPGPPELTAPTSRRISGPVEIAAAAPDAVEVGFAVYFEEVPGQPWSASWHQIGIDFNTDDGITADWDTRSVPGQSRRLVAPVTILAVPCFGLEWPAKQATRSSYLISNRGGKRPAVLSPSPETLEGARQEACDNDAR